MHFFRTCTLIWLTHQNMPRSQRLLHADKAQKNSQVQNVLMLRKWWYPAIKWKEIAEFICTNWKCSNICWIILRAHRVDVERDFLFFLSHGFDVHPFDLHTIRYNVDLLLLISFSSFFARCASFFMCVCVCVLCSKQNTCSEIGFSLFAYVYKKIYSWRRRSLRKYASMQNQHPLHPYKLPYKLCAVYTRQCTSIGWWLNQCFVLYSSVCAAVNIL